MTIEALFALAVYLDLDLNELASEEIKQISSKKHH
jgi:hypothetical protein